MPSATPITAADSLFTFYDIESLDNAFTLVTYTPKTSTINLYILTSQEFADTHLRGPEFTVEALCEHIFAKNPALPRDVRIGVFNLASEAANIHLAQEMGLSDSELVNDPKKRSTYGEALRPVCDTDPDYDPRVHPFLVGYNSYNYDTSMLSLYLYTAFQHMALTHEGRGFWPVSPADMRAHNDRMFSEHKRYMPAYLTSGVASEKKGWDAPPNRIRAAMLSSGRHIDAARLNEKQTMVGLKRLDGSLGHQIMESDRLDSHNARLETLEDLYELMAYNTSDVVGLHKLFEEPTYSSGFDLKQGLIAEYPEVVYDNVKGTSTPDIKPYRVRRGRLCADSTSAKFVAMILSPYGQLKDMPVVDLTYPHPEIAAEMGIEPFNVLEEAKKLFYDNITDEKARRQFDEVYAYYSSIQGKNYNDSENYYQHYSHDSYVLKEIPRTRCTIPYFTRDGKATSCFAQFSFGGIHGAEANMAQYLEDRKEFDELAAMFEEVKQLYPDPLELRKAKKVTLRDGREVAYNTFLTSKSTIKAMTERKDRIAALYAREAEDGVPVSQEALEAIEADYVGIGYKDISAKEPSMFVDNADGSNKLSPKYGFTSAGPVFHEDFTSYYPNLLRNMRAFYNPDLGQDRYAKIFEDKQRYDVLRKDPSYTAAERERFNLLREGTKLILNSASGAGDASHNTPIRMNNTIISMRLIGQLFAWMIGQAQTFAGARIVSTNTDGLYSADLDEETNNRVLAEQAARIHVEIEPEPLLLVSKDSNNRLELEMPSPGRPAWETDILGASGGSLACFKGPHPTNSLSHAAIYDYGLVEYMRLITGGFTPDGADHPLSMDEPMDEQIARQILEDLIASNEASGNQVHTLLMFQNILAATPGKMRYPFACDLPGDDDEGESGSSVRNHAKLQHFNRVFIVKPGTEQARSLRLAAAVKITAAVAAKRARDPEARRVQDDPVALDLLRANGVERNRQVAADEKMEIIDTDREAGIVKITGLDPHWPMLVVNEDLHHLPPERLRTLIDSLDLDIYTQQLTESFRKNWMNVIPD